MRACGVVLYVAVLLCFLNSAFAAACGDHGATLPGFSTCVCRSGYTGAACDVYTASDMNCPVIVPEATAAENFPTLVNASTAFRSNRLFAEISGPHVANRQFLELNFTGATADKCSFGTPSTVWTIKQDCNDSFALELKWTEHGDCGFAKNSKDSTPLFLVVSSTLHLKYKDFVTVPLGVNEETNQTEYYTLERIVSIPYAMSVRFQTTIEVKLLALNITSDVTFGAALTGDEWSPEDGILTLTLTSVINYPNSFGPNDASMLAPENVTVAAKGVEPSNPENQYGKYCPYDQDVPCTQIWTVKVSLASGCSFDGNYTLMLKLYTCRDPDTSGGGSLFCTSSPSNVTFSIATSDVCGQVGITPEVNGELVPFMNKTNVNENNYNDFRKETFKLGEYGNFYAKINSDGNDIYINFTDIRFKAKGANDSTYIYLYQNKQHVLTDNIPNAQLQIWNEKKYFQIYFHSSVFKVAPQVDTKGPSTKKTYTFSATVDILFEGNQGEQKKRTVEYTFERNQMFPEADISLQMSSIAFNDDKSAAGALIQEPFNRTTFVASVVGAIAGTMLIVFVVVGVALRSRSQSARRDAAASAAVLAANTAAQTIDVRA